VAAGGGAVAAAQRRPGEVLCTSGRGGRGGRGVPEEEEGREGSEGLMCKTKRIYGPLGKVKFPANLKP
jgi:hypothetical protein